MKTSGLPPRRSNNGSQPISRSAPVQNNKIRLADGCNQAWLGLQAMRVLKRRCRNCDVGIVAGQLTDERGPLGFAGKNLKRVRAHTGSDRIVINKSNDLIRLSLKLVRAMRAKAHDVLQEPLIVGLGKYRDRWEYCRRRRLYSLGDQSSITLSRSAVSTVS